MNLAKKISNLQTKNTNDSIVLSLLSNIDFLLNRTNQKKSYIKAGFNYLETPKYQKAINNNLEIKAIYNCLKKQYNESGRNY